MRELWRTAALLFCSAASWFLHGKADCRALTMPTPVATATPRIPRCSCRFMPAPKSGMGIVSAQTSALEGASARLCAGLALIRLRQAENFLRDEIEDHVRRDRRDARDHDFAQVALD